jgi:hypothetical protein
MGSLDFFEPKLIRDCFRRVTLTEPSDNNNEFLFSLFFSLESENRLKNDFDCRFSILVGYWPIAGVEYDMDGC